MQEFTLFLNARINLNFITYNSYKDYDSNTGRYLFHECDQHMWKLGNRTLQFGVQYGGGSDWLVLDSKFVNYLSNTNNVLVRNLIDFFNFTSVPLEVFFETNKGFIFSLKYTIEKVNRDRALKKYV